MNDFELLTRLIEHSKSLVIVTHFSPDGDALGGVAALSFLLQSMEKDVYPVLLEPVPSRFGFLQIDRSESLPERHDAIFFLDCETPERIGDKVLFEKLNLGEVPSVNIDHHITNTRFARINFVEMVSSTCELMYDILSRLNFPLNTQLSTDLLTGIIEDTGNFRYPNTSARTLQIASKLLETGADLNLINRQLRKSFEVEDFAVWAKALSNAKFSNDGRVILSKINLQDLPNDTTGVAASSDLLNTLLRLRSAQLVVFLREMPDNRVGVSLRSDEQIDSSVVAKVIGGGGHQRAAGAIVNGALDEVERTVLRVVQDICNSAFDSKKKETGDEK
jgi:phosphoesterase RecJ-like protein